MNYVLPFSVALLSASSAFAESTRQLDAHEHGVGQLDIAFDGSDIAISLHAPGADIVGFEHPAETAEDRAAIDAAMATLARPLELFVFPDAAECTVMQASAELESERGENHAEHDHDHEHGHDHEDHAHEHSDEATHSEFHAEYQLNCVNPDAITQVNFAYFEIFENARELEIQMVGNAGAQGFEVERGAPILDLKGLL